jgi:hypothetical protein
MNMTTHLNPRFHFSRIVLHPIRVQWQLDSEIANCLKREEDFLGRVDKKPNLLSSLAHYSERIAFDEIRERDHDGFFSHIRLAHLSRTWHWRGMQDEGPHRIILPKRTAFECGLIGTNSDVDFSSWLEGIYIVMILRDIGAIKVYGGADPEKVVRYGQNTPDPWEIPYIKFLNGIWAFDTNIGNYLKDALRGSDPTGHNPIRADWLLHILSPLLELWVMAMGKDNDRFNEKLYEQQKLRYDWHAALDEDALNSIMEYIDLAALAAVCYAHDKGFKIEVQSDYLPEFLIKGDFPKLQWPDPEWKG